MKKSKNIYIKPILNLGIGYNESWINYNNKVNFYIKSILLPFLVIQITYIYEK